MMTKIKREIVILDMTLGVEVSHRVTTSIDVLGRLYANIDKSPGLINFYQQSKEGQIIIIVFYGTALESRRRMAFVPEPSLFVQTADQLLAGLGIKNQHDSLESIQQITEELFIKRINLAISIEKSLSGGAP